ncbi:NfeD family protein [Poriferisphaera sp. WC338]|uniref:NfeD family protein n=1 Tax=Poriferisphaera sp. WC338 TaxID=3425129 RepID=UPI003D818065
MKDIKHIFRVWVMLLLAVVLCGGALFGDEGDGDEVEPLQMRQESAGVDKQSDEAGGLLDDSWDAIAVDGHEGNEPMQLFSKQPSDQTSGSVMNAASMPMRGQKLIDVLPSGSVIAVIPVEGDIYDFTKQSMERRVQRALDAGASLIVFKIKTNGGLVTSAIDIMTYLKDPNEVPVPTVAWVNQRAYSAGTLIATSCDEIIMSPSSQMGASAPILLGQNLSPTERAKALSPLLAAFKSNAEDNGYDYAPLHAMCVLGVEVFYIENPGTGERHLVNQADYAWMVEGKEYDTSLYQKDPYAVGAVTYELAEITNEKQKGAWVPVLKLSNGINLPGGKVHAGNTLFTLGETRAFELGLSAQTIGTDAQLRQYYNGSKVFVVPQTWSEGVAGFLSRTWVRAILVVALMVGAYLEFQTPGLGIAGGVALLALILLLGAPLIIGLAEVWHIILFFIGFVLLVIELAFTPSFGLLGILGIVMMFVGLVLNVVPSGGPNFGPIRLPSPQAWDSVMYSTLSIMAGTVVSLICMFFITKYFGRIPFLSSLVLRDERVVVNADAVGQGRVSDVFEQVSGDEVLGGGRLKVGQRGRTMTSLHPAGQAVFDGEAIDVVSSGDWIDRGVTVEIVEIGGGRIVVDVMRGQSTSA